MRSDLKNKKTMKFILPTRVILVSLTLVFSLFFNALFAQSLPSNFESLSDDELKQYLGQALNQGFTIDQIKTLALSKGVSTEQIAAFESRISTLNANTAGLEGQQINNSLEVSNATPIGFTNNVSAQTVKKNPIFGMDFFNNPNISFTPNLNVATPDNYQLGPGDELVINIWGAAESTFNVQVDREGVLRLPNVGPVFVNGMDIKDAKEIVLNKLKQVYGGISAPDSSPYKVFANISLTKVRSVQVNIIGEVDVPGTYTLSSLSTVLNALYAAGGPTENGTFREVKIVRNGEPPVYFDVYQYLVSGIQEGNRTLRDNDLIIVSPYLSRIKIEGAVKRPGTYELKSNENFSDLLKFVSGFKATAYKDQFSIQRIVGDRLAIKEIDYNKILNENLQSGDIISVTAIIDQVENSVSIEGPLFRPGKFEYVKGLTLKDLINKASGLTKLAYLERGLIYRGDNYETKTIIPFNPKEILNGETTIVMQNNDQVKLFNKQFLNFNDKLVISGGVRNPGSFDYYDSLTIEDLVLMAGGLSDKANPNILDIYRKIKDDNFETLSESFKTSVGGGLNFSNTSDFELLPGDRVSVRLLKGINDDLRVEVEGEVNYPGSYSGEVKNERISDFVKKAGGVSPYAFLQGATLIRVNPFYKEEAQGLIIDELKESNTLDMKLGNQKEFRVGINLDEILKYPQDSKENMVLKDGDRIIIPSIKSTVKTEGQVIIPSLIREESGLNFKDYIDKSGGFDSDAVKRKSYVIYPNGDIASTKSFLFFKNYPKIQPGSILVVPKKKVNPNPISAQEVLGLTSGFATIALLVDRLFRN